MRTRIKICGITNPEEALMVAAAGVDAIGLNFHRGPRKIDNITADRILDELPKNVTPVALVRSTPRTGLHASLKSLLENHRVYHFQIYGHVDRAVIANLRASGLKPILIARAPDNATPLRPDNADLAEWVLLDAVHEQLDGGTGKSLDWQKLHHAKQQGVFDNWPPIMLAGGLDATNVTCAIHWVRPAAVDVATGVESKPGRKDEVKVRAFIEAVRSTDTDSTYAPVGL